MPSSLGIYIELCKQLWNATSKSMIVSNHFRARMPARTGRMWCLSTSQPCESCCGTQVLCLALRMQLDGIVPQIMSLPPHMLEDKPSDPATGKTWAYPPTYFMHMELDRATAQRVTADITVLKSKQVLCSALRTC